MSHSNPLMPLLFVGHGSPLLAIQENAFTDEWKSIARKIPKPESIIVISAHWVRDLRFVTGQSQPPQIFDFYGFPEQLYQTKYKVKGNPSLAQSLGFVLNHEWGIDHGAWCVLKVMYPDADIPVIQISLKRNDTPETLLALGQQLKSLRSQKVLIIGSGNLVHNLGKINLHFPDQTPTWAIEFETDVMTKIKSKNYSSIIPTPIAHPSPEHLWPLFPILGALEETDGLQVFNQRFDLGSIAMTSLYFR